MDTLNNMYWTFWISIYSLTFSVDDIVAVFINKTEGEKMTKWVDDQSKTVEVKIEKARPKQQKSGIAKSGKQELITK